MVKKTYEQGLIDGKLYALEQITAKHDKRLNHHSERLKSLERIIYAVLGAYVFIQLLPTLQKIFN